MKLKYYLPLFFLLFAFAQETFAQEGQPVRRDRNRGADATADSNTLPDLTERARIKNAEESKGPGQIAWLREIYRNVDLDKDNNAALYYPIQPLENRMNLFTLIFRLMADGKITTYKYLDGREIFTEQYKENFKEILDKYGILYATQGSGNNVKYVVDEMDIPSADVMAYMVKEANYFDQATGTFKSQVIAICPMLVRIDYYYGGSTTDPLFWVPYEEIKPYLSRELIMTSNYNNAMTYTMDDYFMKGMYTGEIIKTTNLMNESLAQQVARQTERLQAEQPAVEVDIVDDPDMPAVELTAEVEQVDYLKLAQDSIERQLKVFHDGLWVYNDSIAKLDAEPEKKEKQTKSARKTKTTKKEKSSSSSKDSGKKEKATPTRSVRRGNR